MGAQRVTPDTWLIADTHFGHKNIIRYCKRPAECDALILAAWEEQVGAHEDVLHLGDLLFYQGIVITEGFLRRLERLPGSKILLKGNHDRLPASFYANLGFTLEKNGLLWEAPSGQIVRFSHRPLMTKEDGAWWDVNVHGHIHNNGYSVSTKALKWDHRNVSIEVMGYRLVRLREVLDGEAGERVATAPTNTFEEFPSRSRKR
jgi:calcineurin-like phosphoesterase family protein